NVLHRPRASIITIDIVSPPFPSEELRRPPAFRPWAGLSRHRGIEALWYPERATRDPIGASMAARQWAHCGSDSCVPHSHLSAPHGVVCAASPGDAGQPRTAIAAGIRCTSPRLASPRLASPRLASPRLASPRRAVATGGLRSDSPGDGVDARPWPAPGQDK